MEKGFKPSEHDDEVLKKHVRSLRKQEIKQSTPSLEVKGGNLRMQVGEGARMSGSDPATTSKEMRQDAKIIRERGEEESRITARDRRADMIWKAIHEVGVDEITPIEKIRPTPLELDDANILFNQDREETDLRRSYAAASQGERIQRLEKVKKRVDSALDEELKKAKEEQGQKKQKSAAVSEEKTEEFKQDEEGGKRIA